MNQYNITEEEASDIEKEIGNEEIVIEVPFKPEDINIKIVPRNIGQLVELLEDKQILIPKYQRLPNLWNNTKKSRFIESLMLDLPIPLFYFDEGDNKKWYVVDGLQRMSTLEHFMLGTGEVGKNNSQLKLENLEFLTEYNHKTWNDLPKDIKRRINSNQVTINLIGKGTPDEVKYTIFSRINQGDVPLTSQEIRTALFQGYRVDFLEKLVSKETEVGQLFHKVTSGSIKTRRQEDLDFVSRFVSFYIQGYSNYEPDMDRFITTGTKLIPENEVDRRKMVIDFKKALDISWEIFGNDSFRKRQSINDGRKPINKPLFEIISTVFSKLTDDETRELLKNKKEFVTSFIELQNDNKRFWNAITTGTATKDNVNLRNKEFSAFLSNFIK
ncbi:DUF262 domain-containing protein [Sphingobacterium spiritivorum]|uniref:GmrSD restriction endonucleases N-terminal domain-containing protein n=1 Tax=Sphingobacterium spiritivorum ATCC 33861 TaxID=525373 RepID=D7VRX4_SPHSI|nr:DUF262 domain-containing protein [Sphingobacterium spiritivorum]EFK56525.1 hypothetical protein HMPREF0766_13728 [Sphingobacterium spiritivorum ATCC 33861]QQT35411.1 DUF262 domain-containing protein [Sphingobacterium spiritivorum]WQD32097.1 DUF262 domain-containing protein [Sphingobacterium spiritivorum]SUJ05809.1 Uncharacterized conserved protein [Sphingobacterium spiritivorum]